METIYKVKVAFKAAHLLDVREVVVDFDEGDESDGEEKLREIRFDSLVDLMKDKERCSACTRVKNRWTICRSSAVSCHWRHD